jgi:hypothetical protein
MHVMVIVNAPTLLITLYAARMVRISSSALVIVLPAEACDDHARQSFYVV